MTGKARTATQVQAFSPCNRTCKQTHATPQTPRSISQPSIHMDSYMASLEVAGATGMRRTSTSYPTWDPCLKDTKNTLVNITVYRNRNHFCFQRPLTIPVLDIPKTATLTYPLQGPPWRWVRHQSLLRLRAPQAPENSSFTSLVPMEGRIFRTLEVRGFIPSYQFRGSVLRQSPFWMIYVL